MHALVVAVAGVVLLAALVVAAHLVVGDRFGLLFGSEEEVSERLPVVGFVAPGGVRTISDPTPGESGWPCRLPGCLAHTGGSSVHGECWMIARTSTIPVGEHGHPGERIAVEVQQAHTRGVLEPVVITVAVDGGYPGDLLVLPLPVAERLYQALADAVVDAEAIHHRAQVATACGGAR